MTRPNAAKQPQDAQDNSSLSDNEFKALLADVIPHLQAVRMLANDIEPAFGDLREDEKFARYASDLRGAVDATLAAPPLNCAGVQAAAAKIGEACEACHRYTNQ